MSSVKSDFNAMIHVIRSCTPLLYYKADLLTNISSLKIEKKQTLQLLFSG